MIASGVDWLETQRRAHMTRTVTYWRGAASVSVPATIGRTIFSVDKGAGFFERIEARDYLIAAADIILGGVAVTPARGDQIVESRGAEGPLPGVTYVYEVMAPANEPHWRWSDRSHAVRRIHTNLVEAT